MKLRPVGLLVLSCAGVLLVRAAAAATFESVSGQKLLIMNQLPDNESKNKILFATRDPNIDVADPNSPDDPRCLGDPIGTTKATLNVTGKFTGTINGQSFTFSLPCQNWQLIGEGAAAKGYKYKDAALNEGPVRTVVWKRRKLLKAIALGRGPSDLLFDLQEGVSQDPVHVRLTFGAASLFVCAEFGGASIVNGKDGSDGKAFKAKNSPPPALCP